MITYYYQLHFFTKLKVQAGLRLAALGQMDEAREIARFIRNSRIVEILKPYSGQVRIDAHLLDFELRELEQRCVGPSSPALFEKDTLSKILSRLDLIAGLANALANAPSGHRTISTRCNNIERCPYRESDSIPLPSRNPEATLKASDEFSVLQPELGLTAAGVLAFDSHRGTPVETLPAVNAPNGRSEHRAERSIVRLPIDRIIKQATKEPKA